MSTPESFKRASVQLDRLMAAGAVRLEACQPGTKGCQSRG
jgi:hypothetical protein